MSLLSYHGKLADELINEIIKKESFDGNSDNIYNDVFGIFEESRNDYPPNRFIDVIIRLLPQMKLASCARPFRLLDGTFVSENCMYPIEQYRFNEWSPEEIQNGWYPRFRSYEDLVYEYQDFVSINSWHGDFLALRDYLDCGDTYEDYGEESDKPEYVYHVMHPKFLEIVCMLI